MATNPPNQLQTQIEKYESGLNNSPTAFADGVNPTKGDLLLSSKLNTAQKKAEQIKSDQTRRAWYGPDTPASEAPEAAPTNAWWEKTLRALQAPLNAEAGAVQYALGKGTAPTLAESMNNAVKSNLGYGDILKQTTNLPSWARVPLGLTLDIAGDPLSMMTAGTAAIIPRMGVGLAKAGPKGLAIGATSSLAQKALKIPKISKVFPETAGKLAVHGLEGSAKYDELIGRTVADRIGKNFVTSMAEEIPGLKNVLPKKGAMFNSFKNLASKTPAGKRAFDALEYSTQKHNQATELKDMLVGGDGLYKKHHLEALHPGSSVDFKTVDEFMSPSAKIAVMKDGAPVLTKNGDMKMMLIRDADGALLRNALGGRLITIENSKENAQKVLDGLIDSRKTDYDVSTLEKAFEIVKPGRTGVQWYDKVLDKFESTTLGDLWNNDWGSKLGKGDMTALEKIREKELIVKNKVMEGVLEGRAAATAAGAKERLLFEAKNIARAWNDGMKRRANVNWRPLEDFLVAERSMKSLFKLMKVPFNPSSHVVANLGNAIMAKMMGLPVESPEFQKSFWGTRRILQGKGSASDLKGLIENDVQSFVEMMYKNPTKFQEFFGQSAISIQRQLTALDDFGKLNRKITEKELKDTITEIITSIEEGKLAGARAEKALLNTKEGRNIARVKTASEMMEEMAKKGEPRTTIGTPGSWSVNELQIEQGRLVDNIIHKLATLSEENPGNPAYGILNTIVQKMPKAYESIDQAWKIGTVNFLSRHGLTESELIKVSRQVPIGMDDVYKTVDNMETGQKMYLIKAPKAAEVAMETFMNYSAMPDTVRVLRALPIVGSPFFSFPYAMVAKTGKTMVQNPSVFNKIAFAMNEFSGARSPEEKKALQSKYNAYLNSPTVVKLGGMWNTDIKNWVPYYTMNMFNPSERKYNDSFEGKMLELADKFPVMQDPAGQVIKDYFIQPWILSGTNEVPQGQFGQPIMPHYDPVTGRKIDPGIGTKAFYGGRTYAESFVPGFAGFAGPLLGGLSDETLNTLPIGYAARKGAYAIQGKTSLGIQSKEDNMRRTLRTLSGLAGLPLYPLDTTKTSSK